MKNELLAALRKSTLATGRAWSLTELFRFFCREIDAVCVRAFVESWYALAIRSRLGSHQEGRADAEDLP